MRNIRTTAVSAQYSLVVLVKPFVASAMRYYGVASLRMKFEADIYFGFVLLTKFDATTRIEFECTSDMHATLREASKRLVPPSLVMQTQSNGGRIEMLNSIQLVRMQGKMTTNSKWFSVPVDRIGHGQRDVLVDCRFSHI